MAPGYPVDGEVEVLANGSGAAGAAVPSAGEDAVAKTVPGTEDGGAAKSDETSGADEDGAIEGKTSASEESAPVVGATGKKKKKKRNKKKGGGQPGAAVVGNGEAQQSGDETEDKPNAGAATDSADHSTYSGGDGSDSYQSDEDEGKDGYKKGGYHPVRVGEVYNNTIVIRKLGWGHFSTVWCGWDKKRQQQVALKVQKSATHYTEAAMDEIEFLNKAAQQPGRGSDKVVRLLDSFRHSGPNGTHVCMVFEPMGPNLLALIKDYNYRGIPMDIVREITRQVLMGLDFLHTQCSIIHTDLKPENVLLCPHEDEFTQNLEFLAGELVKEATGSMPMSKSQRRRMKEKKKKATKLAEQERAAARAAAGAADGAGVGTSSPNSAAAAKCPELWENTAAEGTKESAAAAEGSPKEVEGPRSLEELSSMKRPSLANVTAANVGAKVTPPLY